MFAAFREENVLQEFDWPVKRELLRKACIFGYMDDVAHVAKSGISKQGKLPLRRLRAPDTYGASLQLVRTFGGEAFAFG